MFYNQIFNVAYQPIKSLSENCIVGYESLIRGIDNPEEFFNSSDKLKIILVDRLARKLSANLSPNDGKIFINCNPLSLIHDAILIDDLIELGKDKEIVLEITEQYSFYSDEGLKTVKKLKDKGIEIALDDFGVGYSNLSLIAKVEPNFIKIDRSLVIEAETNKKVKAVIEAIVLMAERLGINIIAEGIERKSQISYLKDIGVDLVQGYFIGEPVEYGKEISGGYL